MAKPSQNEERDDKYWERRRKNNFAAKKRLQNILIPEFFKPKRGPTATGAKKSVRRNVSTLESRVAKSWNEKARVEVQG